MASTPITAQRLSRLRLYLTVVGILGTLSQAVVLSSSPPDPFAIPLAALGAAIFVAYLVCAAAFEWAGHSRVLLGALVAALVWMVPVGIAVGLGTSPGLLVPLLLFVAIPCGNAILIALDWRDSQRVPEKR